MSVSQSIACSVIREFRGQTGAAEAVVSAYASAAALTSSLSMGEFSVLNVEKHWQMTKFPVAVVQRT
jgi:hypothetical protein